MIIEKCLMGICIELAPIDASAPKFFGFSEFLTSLALMVLAWTTSDVRYRFRIQCAPISLQHFAFRIVTTVGILTLLTDLWRTKNWCVPTFIPLTLGLWQAIMGGALLLTFIFWVRIAFIHPPVYNIYNARRFTQALYLIILKGSKEELPIIADELTHSMKNIVIYATEEQKNPDKNTQDTQDTQEVQIYANTILDLIADRRFCETIASSSPITAIALYSEMNRTKKYRIPVKIFTKNLINEAINNKHSFLYHETNGYHSGLIGSQKPLSQTLFSNYRISEAIGTTLFIETNREQNWDNDQWDAYCRTVLATLISFNPNEHEGNSYILKHAILHIRNMTMKIQNLNSNTNTSTNIELFNIINTIIKFTKASIESLNEKQVPPVIKLRHKHKATLVNESIYDESIYDEISSLMSEIIIRSSLVENQQWKTYIEQIIKSTTLFYDNIPRGTAERVIQIKFRRKIFNEIVKLKTSPYFIHALTLRFCLNTFGIQALNYKRKSGDSILIKAITEWMKNNYDWMYTHKKEIAVACLGDNSYYDSKNHVIIKKYLDPFKQGEQNICLYVNPANPPPASASST